MRVYEVMTRDVVTVRPETPIHEAAELMVTYAVSVPAGISAPRIPPPSCI